MRRPKPMVSVSRDPVPALLQVRNELSVEDRRVQRTREGYERMPSAYIGPQISDLGTEDRRLRLAIQRISGVIMLALEGRTERAREEYEEAVEPFRYDSRVAIPTWSQIVGAVP